MEESISLSGKASTSSSLQNPASRTVCHVCQKQFSQYTCPRCNSRYCSLHCYKSHSLRCTESFMRENVVKELGHLRPDDQTKQKMLDILKRFNSEEEADDMDEDDTILSDETIQKVLSGSEISFDDLSTEEKKQFQRAVASGDLSKMIEPWDPWWMKPSAKDLCLSNSGTQLIQPLNFEEAVLSPTKENDEVNQPDSIPPGPENPLPPTSQISSAKPSPLLAIHLVDIVYTYCFTLRLYNGDWQSDPVGSAMVVMSFSSVLGQGGQPESVLEILSHCLEQTCSSEYRHMGGIQFALGLLDDVVTLLSLGRPALICALCDIQKLIQTGDRDLKSGKHPGVRKKDLKTKLKLADRKIFFLMCWVNEQPEEAWSSLAGIVTAEKRSLSAHASNQSFVRKDGKAKAPGKVVIEELQ